MRVGLICKILDGVSEWTNGCYKCMYDKEFLFMLAIIDNEALKSFLDKEGWKTHFKKHKKGTTPIHDLKIF